MLSAQCNGRFKCDGNGLHKGGRHCEHMKVNHMCWDRECRTEILKVLAGRKQERHNDWPFPGYTAAGNNEVVLNDSITETFGFIL